MQDCARFALTMPEILITGGAGFVGSNLAVHLAERHPDWSLTAFDNLHRRGSELNLPRLEGAGVRFVRGDVREPADLAAGPAPDAIVECSAEPSVMAGTDGDTSFVVHTNLTGAYNCLELARQTGAHMVFLSTSRVYSMDALRNASLVETETRFELASDQSSAGISAEGVAEQAPTGGPRTLYGTTKLAAELLIEEYRAMFGLSVVVDRCGVVGGPWQMGKVDQGVFTHWVLSHHFGLPLAYIGFGGGGKQVRDLIHVDDLAELIELQLVEPEHWDGQVLNVGGGRPQSLSLREASAACAEFTGRELDVGSVAETRAGDVPVYISDRAALFAHSDWRPRRDAMTTLRDIAAWVAADEERIAASLGLDASRSAP